MVAPLREQLQESSLYRSFRLKEKHFCSYYSRWVINDNWAIPEKDQTRGVGVEDIFFENPRGIFRFFTLPLEIPDKTRLHFSDVVLVSNYHGSKGEAIKLIPHYMIDIIYKTVKPSHLKKLQIIQNIKNLYFPVKNIFSD